MANENIITQGVFEKSIKDILTLLVNNTYNFTEYTDEEIGNLIDLDPTQIAELTAVISDSVVAKNKVFSSSHTTELIQKSVIESNEYADSLVANLSNIKLDIVDTLPDASTVNKSTIYILKDSTGGTNNTLNVWSDSISAFVEVGKLNVNMDSYYTKSDVDTLLADKADDNTVVHQDDVVSDMTTTSGTTVLSTSGLKTELDKKANDDAVVKTADIATTIDSASTDSKVASAKSVYDKILDSKKVIVKNFTDTNGGDFIECLNALGLDTDKIYSLGFSDLYTNLPPISGWWEVLILGSFTEKMCIARHTWTNEYYTGNLTRLDGTWVNRGGWKKICSTKVADAPETTVDLTGTDIHGTVKYLVKSGICYVSAWGVSSDTAKTAYRLVPSNVMPKPVISSGTVLVHGDTAQNGKIIGQLYIDDMRELSLHIYPNAEGNMGYGSFSYPVAES